MNPSIILVITIVASATTAAIVPSTTTFADDKCHKLECPKYSVLNKTATWELRRYPETKWVSTNATGASFDTFQSDMFHLLFTYISGANDKAMKIEMTTPVFSKIAHGQGPTCASTFITHFMIPFELQSSPAIPTDPKVYLSSIPTMDVFVRTFGGFAKEEDFVQNLQDLAQEVAALSIKVDTTFFYRADYDGPYQFQNRHNEVLLVKL